MNIINMIHKKCCFNFNGKFNEVYTLSNANGSEVDILNYGARITSIKIKDKFGSMTEFVLGPKNFENYYDKEFSYHGATIGRYANRIGEARFFMGNKEYLLDANQNGHCLHGGDSGFHNKIWTIDIDKHSLILSTVSADGEGGFPGKLNITVKYTLTDDDSLRIEYNAISNKDTHCNFTNHTYFTINNKDVRFFYAFINSRKITAMDEDFVARGGFLCIDDTAYSFNPEKQIGKDICSNDYFIKKRTGYDVNYCINRKTERDLELCAYVYDKESGKRIDCYSTLDGLQFYATKNSGGHELGVLDNYSAFCLEPQRYPNAVNCKTYPSTLLKKGKTFSATIVYKFTIDKVNMQ